MSYVEFASRAGHTRLSGAEYAHAMCITHDIAVGLLDAGSFAAELMSRIVTPLPGLQWAYDLHLLNLPLAYFRDSFASAFGARQLQFRVADGRTASAFQVILNTAVAAGNDLTRLMARLYGQAEMHAWVAEPNRPWLADLINEGRRIGIMRAGQGWEGVAELLRNNDGGPVVTSYSVTDEFPNRIAARWTPPDDLTPDVETWGDDAEEMALEEAWGKLPAGRRWELGVAALRPDVEWSPERHPAPHFGDGLTVFDLTAPLPPTGG